MAELLVILYMATIGFAYAVPPLLTITLAPQRPMTFLVGFAVGISISAVLVYLCIVTVNPPNHDVAAHFVYGSISYGAAAAFIFIVIFAARRFLAAMNSPLAMGEPAQTMVRD